MAIQAPTLETDLDPLAKKQQDQFVKPVPKIEPQRAVSNNETIEPPIPSQSLIAPDIGQYDALGAQTQSIFNKANQDVAKTEQQIKDLETASENKKLADQELSSINEMVKEQSQIPMERGGFFDGMSTTQKIVSGIGLFLASLTPEGAKSAVRIIEGKIDSDLKNQIMKYNQKGKQVEEKKTLYSAYMDRFKDEKTALLATKASILEKLKVNLAAQEAKASSIQMKERTKAAYNEAVVAQQKVQADLYEKILENKKKESSGIIPGYDGVVEDKTAARDFRNANDKASLIKDSLSELRNITNTFGKSFSPTLRTRADSLVQTIQLAMKEVQKLGVLSGDDAKRLDDYIKSPARFFSLDDSSKAQQDELLRTLNKEIEIKARSLGLTKKTRERREYE